MIDILSGISGLVRLTFEGLITAFTDERTGPFLAGILVAIGAVFLVWVLYETARSRQTLARATRILAGARGGDEPERMTAFLIGYPQIDAQLFAIRRIRHPWREFRETLIIPKATARDGGRIISNSSRPQTFFNASSLHMNFSFARHVPNIFVGVGLLGTFIGLIAALTAALETIGPGADPASAQQAIHTLLTTAAAKFYVSAAALAVSIVLTIAIRWCSSRIGRAIGHFNNALEERLSFATGERLASQQLEALHEQTAQLQTFSTDLAMAIGQSVKEAISSSNGALVERLEGIASTFSALVEASRQGAGDAIRGAVTDTVAATLRETTNTFQSIAEGLVSLPSKLERATQSLEAAGAAAAESQTEIARRLQEEVTGTMRSVTASLGEEMTRGSAPVIEGMSRVAGALNESSSGILSALEKFADGAGDLAAALGSAGKESKDAQEQLSSASSTLKISADSVKSATDALGGRLGDVIGAVHELTATATATVNAIQTSQDSIRASVAELSDQWARHVERFDSVDEDLAKVFDTLSQQITSQTDQMRNQVQQADAALARAVTNLEALVESLVDVRAR